MASIMFFFSNASGAAKTIDRHTSGVDPGESTFGLSPPSVTGTGRGVETRETGETHPPVAGNRRPRARPRAAPRLIRFLVTKTQHLTTHPPFDRFTARPNKQRLRRALPPPRVL